MSILAGSGVNDVYLCSGRAYVVYDGVLWPISAIDFIDAAIVGYVYIIIAAAAEYIVFTLAAIDLVVVVLTKEVVVVGATLDETD